MNKFPFEKEFTEIFLRNILEVGFGDPTFLMDLLHLKPSVLVNGLEKFGANSQLNMSKFSIRNISKASGITEPILRDILKDERPEEELYLLYKLHCIYQLGTEPNNSIHFKRRMNLIYNTDFESYETNKKFDLIVARKVLCKFESNNFDSIINKIIGLLNPNNGYLYLRLNSQIGMKNVEQKEGLIDEFQIEQLNKRFVTLKSFDFPILDKKYEKDLLLKLRNDC